MDVSFLLISVDLISQLGCLQPLLISNRLRELHYTRTYGLAGLYTMPMAHSIQDLDFLPGRIRTAASESTLANRNV